MESTEETCKDCGEEHGQLQETSEGDHMCPECIMREAAYNETRLHRERIEERWSEAERNGSGWPR